MTPADRARPAVESGAPDRHEADRPDFRREIADLHAELEATNQGLIALHAELENARDAEARLAAIVQSSDDAMFSMTSAAAIQTWNSSAERLLGYGAHEVMGRPAGALFPEDAGVEFEEALRRIRAGERAMRYDTRQRRKDGSVVDVAVTVSAMRNPDDVLTGFSAVVRDITKRLRMEAELAAARADQQVMADRDRIARDLHDMVIQRVFAAGVTLQATATLIDHPGATARLQSVIGELDLTIAELRTAIFDLHRPPREASSLRARVLELTSDASDGLGFVPTVAFDGPIDASAPDDVTVHLLAVVREALSNIARHARASAAEVTISAGTDLVLQVTDNGCGIGEVTRTSGLDNMGERARALGGTFEVTGAPDAGTRLVWTVPLA